MREDRRALVSEMMAAVDHLWLMLLVSFGSFAVVGSVVLMVSDSIGAALVFGLPFWAFWIAASVKVQASIRKVEEYDASQPLKG